MTRFVAKAVKSLKYFLKNHSCICFDSSHGFKLCTSFTPLADNVMKVEALIVIKSLLLFKKTLSVSFSHVL